MKTIRIAVVAVLSSAAFAGCNIADIPMVGMDKDGNPVQVSMGRADYTKNVGIALSSVQDSVLPVMNRHANGPAWLLRTVVVGIGVNTEIGIGSWKVGAVPRFRVAFTNSSDPSLP